MTTAKKTPAITSHLSRARTAENDDNDFAVGVLNLTRTEAGRLMDFAYALQVARASAPAVVPSMARERVTLPDVQRVRVEGRTDRDRWITGMWEDGDEQAKREPEPEEPRNRFSGLDL